MLDTPRANLRRSAIRTSTADFPVRASTSRGRPIRSGSPISAPWTITCTRIYLYSVDCGKSTQVTSEMADADSGLRSRWEISLLHRQHQCRRDFRRAGHDQRPVPGDVEHLRHRAGRGQASPIAPELDDEKPRHAADKEARERQPRGSATKQSPQSKPARQQATKSGSGQAGRAPKPIKVDLDGISDRDCGPAAADLRLHWGCRRGLKGSLYFLERPHSGRFAERGATLSRWTLEDRKTEKLAEHVESVRALRRRRKDAAGAWQRKAGWRRMPAGRRAADVGHRSGQCSGQTGRRRAVDWRT